jgi:exodeoxyribonuclease VII large subunit
VRSLFDGPAVGRSGPRGDRDILTVSELNARVRDLLEESFGTIWVEGEISNLRRYPSGHTYFTLKDSESQVAAVLFRGAASGLRFRPEDGLKVLIRGRVSLYEPRGSYQIIVEMIEPAGLGELQLAFEQLKARLLGEGLFDTERKRSLPLLPRRIGIVTSPVGAAIRDILRVLRRRFAGLEIVIAPARVQGEGAADEIVAGIRDLSRLPRVDVIIVTRGGGSLEDLWPFNEESVARAIVGSPIPVISAVGHEVDITISDLVADLRAPTPSAAAEVVVRSRREFLEGLAALLARLEASARLCISAVQRELGALGAERAFQATRGRLRDRMQRVDDLTHRLRSQVTIRTERMRHRVEILGQRISPRQLAVRLAGQRAAASTHQRLLQAAATTILERAGERVAAYGERLTALSPLEVLARGYSICRLEPSGSILKDASDASPGAAIRVRLHRGGLDCEVKEVHRATREERV